MKSFFFAHFFFLTLRGEEEQELHVKKGRKNNRKKKYWTRVDWSFVRGVRGGPLFLSPRRDPTIFFIFFLSLSLLVLFQVVSSVSSRLHLNRLSRPDLSLSELSSTWRRRVSGLRPQPPDWSSLGVRLRQGLSRLKVQVPDIKMPPIRSSRRGWCGCFQVRSRGKEERMMNDDSFFLFITPIFSLSHFFFLIYTEQKDEPPEITYCVVNQNGMLQMQPLSPALPMPEESELDAKFTELLVRGRFSKSFFFRDRWDFLSL